MVTLQAAWDTHFQLVDKVRDGKSLLGPLHDNSYKRRRRGELFYLYRKPRAENNAGGQHTATTIDIERDSNILLLKQVSEEVIKEFLASGGPPQRAEFDVRSGNVFENTTAKDIYLRYGNAAQTSVTGGRGEGGGQLPMCAESTYNLFCCCFGVTWDSDLSSWQRVTDRWPFPDGIRLGVFGPGFGEEWLLMAEGRKALLRMPWLEGEEVPELFVVGFEIDAAVSSKCQENAVTLGLQDVVHCYKADFFRVAVLARFESSIVQKFRLTHVYTTAAIDELFSVHFYCFGLLHGLVTYSDCFTAAYFIDAYNTAFPVIRGAESGCLTREKLPSQLCEAHVRGGDGINSRRPLWSCDCRGLPEADRSAAVAKLAQSIKVLSEDLWTRSRGSHTVGFGRQINYLLEPRHYGG